MFRRCFIKVKWNSDCILNRKDLKEDMEKKLNFHETKKANYKDS